MHDEGKANGPAEIEARRSLLKKIGVAGAAVWVAPAVLSTAAHAQGSSPSASISNFQQWCDGDLTSPFFPDGGASMDVTTSGPGLYLIQYVDGVWDGGCYGPLNVGTSGQGFSKTNATIRSFEIRASCPPPGGPVLASAGPTVDCN